MKQDAVTAVISGNRDLPAMQAQRERYAGYDGRMGDLGSGLPASDLPLGSWDARDLVGDEVDRVVEELHAAVDWPGRYAAVSRFLVRLADRTDRAASHQGPPPEVEEAWRIVDPILDDATPVYEYEPGSWGPVEVSRIAPNGGWVDILRAEQVAAATT